VINVPVTQVFEVNCSPNMKRIKSWLRMLDLPIGKIFVSTEAGWDIC
jgi:hypothetical protein